MDFRSIAKEVKEPIGQIYPVNVLIRQGVLSRWVKSRNVLAMSQSSLKRCLALSWSHNKSFNECITHQNHSLKFLNLTRIVIAISLDTYLVDPDATLIKLEQIMSQTHLLVLSI